MSISLQKRKNGELAGSIGMIRDPSDIKKLMAELKALNRQLQEGIKRSNQMEVELRQARDQLERVLAEHTSKHSPRLVKSFKKA